MEKLAHSKIFDYQENPNYFIMGNVVDVVVQFQLYLDFNKQCELPSLHLRKVFETVDLKILLKKIASRIAY